MKQDLDMMHLAHRIKSVRQSLGLTLNEVEKRCGLGASTVSKIERGTISPSYATLLRLSKGLNVDLIELIQQTSDSAPKTRRAITRAGEGVFHSIGSHDYQLLCTELNNKKMTPMLAVVHAREIKDIPLSSDRQNGMSSHDGEEVLFVVSGEVILHTEFYSPVTLRQGDCAYIDSNMGHVCLKGSEEDAVIFWVCTDIIPMESS
ncbi:helix-turn-helix domain-containing protein [Amphritea sp.]|uniref:helix-turn-helix domain-containing protein n=1 Tax=Amphritea sp. TaxID=1872502 RepID=UPI003A8CBDBA